MRTRYNQAKQCSQNGAPHLPQNGQQGLQPSIPLLNPCTSNWSMPPSSPAVCFPPTITSNRPLPPLGYLPHGVPNGILQNWNPIMAANASIQTGGNFLFNAGFGSMGQVIPVQYLPLPMVPLSLSPHLNQFVQAPGTQNLVAGNENWDGGLLHNGRNQIHNQGIVDKPLINDANQNAMLDPHSTKLQQPQVGLLSSKSQMDSGGKGGYDRSNLNLGSRNFQRKFHGQNKASSHLSGSQKFHANHNGKRNFQHWSGRKGHQNMVSTPYKFEKKMAMEGPTRTAKTLNYTAEEVKIWRQERKKNFPTKANIEKSLSEKESSIVRDKIRRQQLKEILEKQAELGVEVAELPPNYLSESGNPIETGKNGRGRQHKRGNFRNKFDKRSKNGFKDGHNKRKKLDCTLPNTFPSRNPSLLEKLLSSDIKREKSHLLQIFRFMVLNSFFKDWPEKPLQYPLVGMKGSVGETDKVEQQFASRNGDLLDGGTWDNGEENQSHSVIDEEEIDDDDEMAVAKLTKLDPIEGEIDHSESEEGEITD